MEEKTPEKEPVQEIKEVKERVVEAVPEIKEGRPEEGPEEREVLAEKERIIREKLEKEIQEAKLAPELETEAKERAEEIEPLDEKGKLQRLLNLAQEKGVAFAVGVAKDMQDPYVLDILHDALIQNELYKQFEK